MGHAEDLNGSFPGGIVNRTERVRKRKTRSPRQLETARAKDKEAGSCTGRKTGGEGIENHGEQKTYRSLQTVLTDPAGDSRTV